MTPKQKFAGASLVVAAALGAVAVHLSTDPNRLDFDTGCVQNASVGTLGTPAQVYSGDLALFRWQWGFISINWSNKQILLRDGVGKSMAPFCQPAVNIVGDCWQSVGTFSATPGAPKWLVAANVANMCNGRGLQVWKYSAGNWQWKGMIPANIKTPGELSTLEGDSAYVLQNTGGPPRFVRFDLNAMTVAATDLTSRPDYAPQTAFADGSTLRLFADHPTPLPSPYPGPHKYHVLLEGGAPPPGPTPVPVPPGPDPFAAWDEQLAREGVTVGCGAGKFCPDAPMTREQAAVWLLKTLHGPAYVPPPCSGMFVDVPCAP